MNRRKLSEIYVDMNDINNRKPTQEELDQLAEVLNDPDMSSEEVENEHS